MRCSWAVGCSGGAVAAREESSRADERCELGADERLLYDALRAAAQKEVQEELAKGGSVLHALELLLRFL